MVIQVPSFTIATRGLECENSATKPRRTKGRGKVKKGTISVAPTRQLGVVTSYVTEKIGNFSEGVEMKDIYKRQPLWTEDWHEELGELLRRRYEIAGWSRAKFMQDFSMLREICGEKHPAQVFLQDLEAQVIKRENQAGRADYISRIKSVFNSLRMLGVIPLDHRPDDGLPKLKAPRYSPRPIGKEQAIMLMTTAREPMREWFMFACLAGLRACEVAKLEGSWLEKHADGYFLRIFGKGNTEIVIPCHPKLVELIQSKNVLGRLYHIDPNWLSRNACAEMRRLGIATRRNGVSGPKLSFHSCRHFFATQILASCQNLITTQRLMRHASPTVTARYADLVSGEERKIVDGFLSDIDWA
jgi:integrase